MRAHRRPTWVCDSDLVGSPIRQGDFTLDRTVQNTGAESLQPDYEYVWSARYIDAPVLRDKNTDSDGLCDDGRLYYLTDGNFNVTTLCDTGGDAVERYLYDPYGVATIYTGDWSSSRSTSSYSNVYRYTGRAYDPNTGLYHYRHRSYHAPLGRFLTRDPILYGAGDASLYRYVANLATTAADPLGTIVDDRPPHVIRTMWFWKTCKRVSETFKTRQKADKELKRYVAANKGRMEAAGTEAFVSWRGRDSDSRCYFVVECERVTKWDEFWFQQNFMLVSPIGMAAQAPKAPGLLKGAWNVLRGLFGRGGGEAPIDPNKLHHIFGNARHNLGALLSKVGSQEDAFRAIHKATEAVVKQKGITGVFKETVTVAGETITVKGKVVGGVVRIGTAYK